MSKGFFINENQLKNWLDAATNIRKKYGIEKALGYIIGEKFYNLMIKRYHYSYSTNKTESVLEKQLLNSILIDFANLIKNEFETYEIKSFFNSNPRFGAIGHVLPEEKHRLLIENEAVDHSIDTEIQDALIFGDMKKLFDL